MDILEINAVTAGGDRVTGYAPSEEAIDRLLLRFAAAHLGAAAASDPAAIARFMTPGAREKVRDFLILHLNAAEAVGGAK